MSKMISNRNIPKRNLTISFEEVHVWRAELDRPQVEIDRSFDILSPDEQIRATNFYFDNDRSRYIIAHGSLRTILSFYLDVSPAQFRINYTSEGKPILADACDGDIRFNLSHAEKIAKYVVALNRDVGIDIEYIRPNFDCDPLITRFFSPDEQESLKVLPSHERIQMFYRYWVLKEAYIKARGEGLLYPLESFSISFDAKDHSPQLEVPTDPEESTRWSLKELKPGRGYAGAIAVEGHGWNLKSYEFKGF